MGLPLKLFICFLLYALQILVSLDSPIIARAAAGLAAFAALAANLASATAMLFCPKIFMCRNIVPPSANVKSVF